MNRFEALLLQIRTDGTTNLPEVWIVCLKCLDSWLGRPGDRCMICGGETKPTPLVAVSPHED